jgi:hypothetical protein
VFATMTTTELFFRQAVGRLVRWRRGARTGCSSRCRCAESGLRPAGPSSTRPGRASPDGAGGCPASRRR